MGRGPSETGAVRRRRVTGLAPAGSGRRVSRTRLAATVAAALGLVAAGCGPRLPHSDFVKAAGNDTSASRVQAGGQAVGSVGTPGAPGGADASGGAAATGTAAAGTGGATDGGAGAAPAAGSAQAAGSPTAPAGGGGAGAAGGGNTASDVGVTADSILVGNITSVGGPLGPNVFSPSYYGAAAYFQALNEKGGVNGRKIKFVTCDDKEDPNQDLQCAQNLIEGQKVFAFASNDSRVENGAANYVNSKNVPSVADFCIGNWCYKYPMYFFDDFTASHYPRDGKSVGVNGTVYTQDGPYKWFKEKLGISKAAVFFYSIAISRQAGLQYANGLQRQGVDVAYYGGGSDQGENPAAPTYDTDVVQMRSKGVDTVWNTIDMNGFQKLCQSMDRYNFTVKANVGNPQAYGDVVSSFSSPCRNSVYAFDTTKAYSDTSDPAVNEVLAAMKKYYPKVQLHDWVLAGYAGARELTDGVGSMGANVTRDGLVKWLNGLQNYTNGDLVTPHDYTWPYDYSQPAPQCFSVAKWDDSAATMKQMAPVSTCYTMPWVGYQPLDDGS